MAPEIFDNKVFTVKADVYSFGVSLVEKKILITQ